MKYFIISKINEYKYKIFMLIIIKTIKNYIDIIIFIKYSMND